MLEGASLLSHSSETEGNPPSYDYGSPKQSIQGVSFAKELRVGFDQVCKFTEDGLKHTKDVISLFKKRQAIELEYAKQMGKLSQSFLALLHEDKKFDDIITAGTERSLNVVYSKLLEEIQYLSIQHEQFSLNLGAQVVDTLGNSCKDLETIRKQLVAEGQRHTKALQDEYTLLKKHQATHAGLQKEAEEASDACEKAKHNFLTKDAAMAKLEGKKVSALEKADGAMKQASDQQDKCKTLQELHYSVLMPRVLHEMEQIESERCHILRECFSRSVTIALDCSQKTTDLNVALKSSIEAVDIRVDIDKFIGENKTTDDFDVPISSILDPTLKAHLGFRLWESQKGFKDYVIVFVAWQNRLYYYESENSQHPKGVIELPRGDRVVRPADESLFLRNYCFQLTTDSQTYFFGASDREQYNLWFNALYEQCSAQSRALKGGMEVKSLELKVIEAKDLGKSGDYYCLVLLDSERQARTRNKNQTSTPFWNQTFVLDNLMDGVEVLTIQVYRTGAGILNKLAGSTSPSVFKRMGTLKRSSETKGPKPTDVDVSKINTAAKDSDTFVGYVTIPRAVYTTLPSNSESWFDIMGVGGESSVAGSIRLKLNYTDEYIRPERDYEAILSIFNNKEELKQTIKILERGTPSSERVPLCTAMMGVASGQHSLMEFLLELCRVEIEGTVDSNTLFRGNSLASKAVDAFMKIKTIEMGKFLQNALGSAVQMIYDQKTSCEVDPTRLSGTDTQKEVAQNWKRLLSNTNLVWNSILHAMDTCPEELKFLFHHLRKSVAEKFESFDARQSSIAGFFFLRLIAPAIMGPQLFGLQEHHPEDHVARTLTLISKTIQNLANNVNFGVKEGYMIPMNEFLALNFIRMKDCLEQVCSLPKQKVEATLEKADLLRELAAMSRILNNSLTEIKNAVSEENKIVGEKLINAIETLAKTANRRSLKTADMPAPTTMASVPSRDSPFHPIKEDSAPPLLLVNAERINGELDSAPDSSNPTESSDMASEEGSPQSELNLSLDERTSNASPQPSSPQMLASPLGANVADGDGLSNRERMCSDATTSDEGSFGSGVSSRPLVPQKPRRESKALVHLRRTTPIVKQGSPQMEELSQNSTKATNPQFQITREAMTPPPDSPSDGGDCNESFLL